MTDMTMFTPYMNSDICRMVPEWQRLERYEYCAQPLPRKRNAGIFRRFLAWVRG